MKAKRMNKTIIDFFKDRSTEQVQHDPEFSEWMDVFIHDLKSGKIAVSDPRSAPYHETGEGGVVIDLENGVYSISIMGVAYGSDKRIARLRLTQKGRPFTSGEEIGDVHADSGVVGVYEPRYLGDFIRDNQEKFYDWIDSHTDRYGEYACGCDTTNQAYGQFL